jgi:hypothetical protein
MAGYADLRGYLLNTYHDKGYKLFRYPQKGSENNIDSIVQVKSPRQFFTGRDYMAIPNDFAKREHIEILSEAVGKFANIEFMTMIFRTNTKGVSVEEIGTKKVIEFSYYEFINVIRDQLPDISNMI